MIRAATSRMRVRGGGKPVQAPVFNSDSASRRKAIAGSREGGWTSKQGEHLLNSASTWCQLEKGTGAGRGWSPKQSKVWSVGHWSDQPSYDTNGNCGGSLQHSCYSVRACVKDSDSNTKIGTQGTNFRTEARGSVSHNKHK